MTTVQDFMLAVSFGAVAGTFIGNVITLIYLVIADHKEKKRKEKTKK